MSAKTLDPNKKVDTGEERFPEFSSIITKTITDHVTKTPSGAFFLDFAPTGFLVGGRFVQVRPMTFEEMDRILTKQFLSKCFRDSREGFSCFRDRDGYSIPGKAYKETKSQAILLVMGCDITSDYAEPKIRAALMFEGAGPVERWELSKSIRYHISIKDNLSLMNGDMDQKCHLSLTPLKATPVGGNDPMPPEFDTPYEKRTPEQLREMRATRYQ